MTEEPKVPSAEPGRLADGRIRMVKINAWVLGIGSLALTVGAPVLHGEVLTHAFLMLYFNMLGVAVNTLAVVVFAIMRRPKYALGAFFGVLIFGLVGFGLCLGTAAALGAAGLPEGSLY